MAAAFSFICSYDSISLATSSHNLKKLIALQPVVRFRASASSISSRSRLCFDSNILGFVVKASVTPDALVMDQSASSSPAAPTIVEVDLGNRSYPIYIGYGLLNQPELLQRDPSAFAYAIKRSCENKAEVVSLDEKESGLRATLNLGHTFGHAIETGAGYGHWLHGEAVAAGTVMAVDMSYRLGWIDESLVKRVYKILQQAKLPIAPPETITVDMFKSVMAVDKKVADGLLRLILLKGPLGNCVFTGDYDRRALDDTLRAFCKS